MAAPAIGVAYNVIPAVLECHAPNSPADKAGIKKGDRVKKVEFVLPKGKTSDNFGKDPIPVDFNPREHGKPSELGVRQRI